MDTDVLLLQTLSHLPLATCRCGFTTTCGKKKKMFFSMNPEPKRFFSGNFSEFFLQSLCIKWGSNERSALAGLWVFGSGIILHKESACSCRSRTQRNMPTFSQCKSRCGWNFWHEARAQGQMQIFHISFFKCLFRLRQGWYLAREFNINLMKGIIGQETEAGVMYSNSQQYYLMNNSLVCSYLAF